MARWNATRRARINLKTTAPEHVAATVAEFAGQPATVEIVDATGAVRASGAAAVTTDNTGSAPRTRIRGTITAAASVPAGTVPAEVRVRVTGGDELVAFTSGVGAGEIPFRRALRAGQRIAIDVAIPVPARLLSTVPTPVNPLLAPSLAVGAINATTIRVTASPAGSAAAAVRVFRKTAAGGERALVGTITPPATSLDDTGRTTGAALWYDAVSVDATGNEGQFSAERTATPQAVSGAMVTTVSVHNPATTPSVNYTGVPAVDAWFRFGVPLALGDVPAGASVQVRDTDGTTILPTQQDQESTWPQDGSLAFVVLTVKLTGTLAVGATRTLQIWRNSTAADQTPNVTPAQVAASSDFKIEVTDGSFGADVLSVSLNRIFSEGQAAATSGATKWGANPLRGWERIRSGPLCTTYHGWEVLRRDSDGARHKQIRGDLYVTAYGNGVFEVFGLLTTPNCDGSFAGATLGDDLPHRKDGVVRLKNGATVIRQFGGAADPRKTDYPAASVNTGEGSFNGSTVLDTGMPVRVSSTGTLPAGVSANTTYFVNFTAGTKRTLFPSRRAIFINERRVGITSQGSGTITLTPMVSMHFLSPVWLCGTDMRAEWVGADKPAELLVAYDHAYLTTKSRAVPMYRNDPSLYPSDLGYAAPYYPNLATQTLPRGLSGTGDGGRDERIGYLSVSELVGLILHPHNLQSRRRARHIAHWTQEWGYDLMNPATGETVSVADPSFAGLGASRPTYVLKPESTGIMGSSNPSPLQTMHQQGWQVMDAAATGKTGGYQEYIDGSHLPNHWTGQYIQSGEPWFLRAGVGLFACLYASLERNENWAGIETGPYGGRYGNVFYGIKQGQVRSKGWAWRTAGFVQHLAPDTHPVKAYAKQSLEHAIALYADAAKPDSNAMNSWKRAMRVLTNSGEDIVGGFHHGFWSQGWAMLRWRGYYPRIEEAWAFWKRAAVGIFDGADTLDGTANGCAMLAMDYFIYNRRKTGGGDEFDTGSRGGYTFNPATDQLETYKRVFDWRNTFAPNVWPLPLVKDGSFACNPDTMDAGNYTRLQRAALAIHAVAGDTQARKVYNDINAATAGRLSFNNEARQAIDIPAGM